MTTMWMVRGGKGGEYTADFLEKGIVALGYDKLGTLSPTIKKDELIRLFAEKYPSMKEGKRATWASQILRFIAEIKEGDLVTVFDRDRRLYILGTVTSAYQHSSDMLSPDMPYLRRVRWTHQTPRDLLSVETKNTLGAIQTLFKISASAASDLQKHQVPFGAELLTSPRVETTQPKPEEEEDREELRQEQMEKGDSFIEDAINHLTWEQMQDLVAGILRAMGYRTTVSEPGPDRGVDVFASPDGLGLQEPRIFVEVKHRTETIGAEKLRAFLGGRNEGDRCLYVSTGGFTKDAIYEAARAKVPLRLINLPELRKIYVERYDDLDSDTRALVPLKKYYWPAG